MQTITALFMLALAALQPLSAWTLSPWATWSASNPVWTQTVASTSLIQTVEKYFQDGLKSLSGKGICDYSNSVLTLLASSGKIHLSKSGPPQPDKSLLNNPKFWGVASVQDYHDLHVLQYTERQQQYPKTGPPAYDRREGNFPLGQVWGSVTEEYHRTHPQEPNWDRERPHAYDKYYGSQKRYVHMQEDPSFFVLVDENVELKLTEVLFPGQSSSIPHSKLLNMTLNCATGQLDVHAELNGGLEILPQVLSFGNVIMSLRVKVTSKVKFDSLVLSANTELFGKSTFVAVKYDFTAHTFSIPPSLSLSPKQFADHIPTLKAILNTLPGAVAKIMDSSITAFNYNPQTKELTLQSTTPEAFLIRKIVKLTRVKFSLNVITSSDPSLKSLAFSGIWKLGSIDLVTHLKYNAPKRVFHVTATTSIITRLSAKELVQKIAGFSYSLPTTLVSFTLTEIVGNIYDNGKYFIAMQGLVSNGKMYVLLYKGSDGLKIGVAASLRNFHLSDIVKSGIGIDVSDVPYFGGLVIPSLALSITSGAIKSPTLPHIFGSTSPLLLYGDTLPAGATALFKLDIANVKGTTASYKQSVMALTIPDSEKLSVKSLFAEVPELRSAINSIPSQLRSILEAKVTSVRYNFTAKQLSMSVFLQDFTILTDFLSISNVNISYIGNVASTIIATESLDFKGTWKIGEYAIQTIVMYDGILKRISVSGQSQGAELNVKKFLEGIAGTDLVLPSAISSFTLTGISGRITERTAVVVFNGRVKSKDMISIVVEKKSSGLTIALAADISALKLSLLVKSATGVDISNTPLLGSIIIPELKFAVASDNIKTPLLAALVSKGSVMDEFKNGLFKGIAGKFVIEISGVSNIAVEFVHKRLSFSIPDTTSLSLATLLSSIPRIKSVIDKLPPQMLSILKAKISSFEYNPDSMELHFSGVIDNTVELIPQFVSLTSVKVSLTVVVSSEIYVSKVDFVGSWVLHKLPIHTTVSYNREEKRLDILGEVHKANGGVNIKELIMSLSGQTLPIPSTIPSSVTLRKLSGNKIGDNTVISLSGVVGSAEIYIIYQKSKSVSSIALAVEMQKFRFASLVSSAAGMDITNFPFFGSLVIPEVGFIISSSHINNPLLSGIYRSGSFLDKFGDQISKGTSAAFRINLGAVKGVMADFANKELELAVPDTVVLSLSSILKLIPGVQNVLSNLRLASQDITNTRIHKIYYTPTSGALQFSGTLQSLKVIPDVVSLTGIQFEFSGVIGDKPIVNYARFKGNWALKSLSLTTEVTYRKMLLLEAYPTSKKSVNVQDFLKGFTGMKINIPSVLNTMKVTRVIGKVDGDVTSIVLAGEIANLAKVATVFQKTANGSIIAFAADVKAFKLSELIKVGAGIDISSVPFFGDFIIPALSFVISSDRLSTDNFPDIKIPGIPKELLLETIPKGLKGQFLADIGNAVGLKAEYFDNILTIKVPPSVSLSLKTLTSVIPQVKSTIDSLPSTVHDILSAKITKLVFKSETKEVAVSLHMSTLNVVPKVITLRDVQLSISLSMKTSQIQSQSLISQIISPKAISFHYKTPAEIESEEIAAVQAVSINTIGMKAVWMIRGITIKTEVTYDTGRKKLNFEGIPTGSSGLSITDVIKGLAGGDLRVPSVLSSLKLTKVLAQNAEYGTIVIITATAGNANVYVVFDALNSGTNIAVAADIEDFKLADLIKTATDVDVSNIPFIGGFVIPTMAFCISTDTIYSNLFTSTFDSDSPLMAYDQSLPKGVTAYFKVDISGHKGIEVTYVKSVLDFNVPPTTGLTLQGLLSEIPSIDSTTKSLPSPIRDLLASKLTAIRFDQTTATISVAARIVELKIIPNVMLLRNLHISVIARLGSDNRGLESLDFSADWVLRKIEIRVKVSYQHAIKKVLFVAIPKEGLSIQDLISGLTGTSLPLPTVINSVKLTSIIGEKVADVFTFIFSGSIAGKAKVHLVFQTFGETKNIAIAVGLESFKLADLVKAATDIDITGIPFFGTFSVPSIAFAIAKNELSIPLLSQVIGDDSPLARYGSKLPTGFTAEFQLPIGKVQGVVGIYENRVLLFKVPDNVDVSLGDLVSQIPGVDIKPLALPPVIGDVLQIKLSSFSFDIPQKVMSVQVSINKITFFNNLLSITKTSLKLVAKLSTPRMLSAEINGVISIGDTDLAVDLRRDPNSKIYIATIRSKVLPIFAIAKQIGAAILPDDLNTLLGKVFNFDILNANIVYPFGAVPQQVLISGTPQMLGLKNIHMTAVAIKYGGKMRLIQNYSFGQFNIAEFLKKLTGLSLHKLVFLNQRVDIRFTVSPTTIKHDIIKIPEFKGIAINKGITFKLPFGYPPNCESDPLCAVTKKILGNVRLTLEATITNAKSYTYTASVGDLRLGSGVVLQRAGLQIQAGTSPSTGIVGSIKLKKPDITLNAAIRATISGVKLEGSMSGCWYNAFGSQYLTICNLLLSVTVIPAPAPISGLEFGGRIHLGKRSCGKALTAEGYIGVNTINPSENYFYAKIDRITFQRFFDAFCVGVSLPRPLAESGFPDGFQASFSLLGKELPHAKISIPAGYRYKGTINILGLRAYADISIFLPQRISVKASLPPIRIARLFKMYASRTDRSRGPFLHADITTSRIHIEASGFVELLGMSAEVKLLITSSKYAYSINGKFLNLFYVSLRIQASYGNLANANYQVEGWFKNDLFDRIARIVRDGLKRSADEADRHINAAKNKIREKQATFNNANRVLVNAQRKVDDTKLKFDHAIAKLEHARRRSNSICHIRSCGSHCVGCPRGWHCCGSVWGRCVCKRPGWDGCCWRVRDVPCDVANAACWTVRRAVDLALRVATSLVDRSRHILNVAKAALNVARGAVYAAKHSFDIAIGFLDGVRATYRVGVRAISAVANFVLTKIINIREIYFRVGLNTASSGAFVCHVKGVLMGGNINVNLRIDTRNIGSIARSLADRAIPGLSKFIG